MNAVVDVGGNNVQVGLDRLVIGMPYPKPPKSTDQTPFAEKQIAQYLGEKKEYVSHMKYIQDSIRDVTTYHVSKTKNKDLMRFKIMSETDGSLLCIFTLGFNFGKGVINIEVNPSKFSPAHWVEFRDLMELFFSYGYDELYVKGVVSHAEFFVDVPGEVLSGLVLIDNSRRKTTQYEGTTYHGRRGSCRVATIYDKAKEQKQEGQLVRVEVRINRRDIRLQVLVENDLFNPFSNLLVVDVNQLQLAAQEMKNPTLASKIKEHGLYGAVKNKPARDMILGHLNENAVAWWHPELFWEVHRSLLMNLKPEIDYGFSQILAA